jgi:hypothetical protein
MNRLGSAESLPWNKAMGQFRQPHRPWFPSLAWEPESDFSWAVKAIAMRALAPALLFFSPLQTFPQP